MSSVRPNAAEVRAFVDRDWARARAATESYFAEHARSRGPRGGVEVGDALWADMRALDPSWPDAAQRREDRAHHLVVCEKLARLAHVRLAR